MRLKATFVTVLAVILLASTCLASACEASCAVKSLGLTCHDGARAEASTHRGHPDLARMQHCAMGQSSASPDENSASVGGNKPCHHQMCGEQPVLRGDGSRSATHLLIVSRYAATLIASLSPPAPSSQFPAAETPPLRTPSPISLPSVLRV
jgi:hypothetical protein